MVKKIRIYLDSSDYLRMYRGEAEEVKEFVKAASERGQIEVGYSYPLLWEVLQAYEPEFKEDRVLRARCIKEICGRNAFRWLPEIKCKGCFSEYGEWFPDSANLNLEMLVKGYRDHILENDKSLNRNQRRHLKGKSGLKKLAEEMPGLFQFSDETFDALGIRIGRKFIDENIFYRYAIGEVSKSYANKEFRYSIFDPEYFMGIWYEYYEGGNLIIDDTSGGIPRMIEGIKQARTAYADFVCAQEECRKAVKVFEDTSKTIGSGKTKQLIDMKKRIKETRNYASIAKANLQLGPELKEILPDHAEEVLLAYFIDKSKDLTAKVEGQDFVDILHSFYIPCCDLWRGDKDFSQVLIRNKIQGYEKVVPKLAQLPSRIDELLS